MSEATEGKRVFIKFANGNRPGEEALITPGVTTADLLQNFGLQANQYSVGKGSQQNVFNDDEPLYPAVNDGDVLYVTAKVDAGEVSTVN